jgi:CheY-like chemotaxis protein
MLFKEWKVLLVDDEPDVLTVTKLALKDVRVYDLPLKLYTAHSKAEAIEKLDNLLALPGLPGGALSVAFIDVVMETEHAGMELCDYIRNTMKNWASQLYIRTGQPGIAPERKVIDEYDISGYITKVEATEQKLYTLIKSGIRQWYSVFYGKLMTDMLHSAILNAASKEQLLLGLRQGETGFESEDLLTGIIFEGSDVLSYSTPQQVFAVRDELDKLVPLRTTPEGHRLLVDGSRVMVHIVETPGTADYVYVLQGKMEMPESLLDITFRTALSISTLWKRAP